MEDRLGPALGLGLGDTGAVLVELVGLSSGGCGRRVHSDRRGRWGGE